MTPTTVRTLVQAVNRQSDRNLSAIAGIVLMITLTIAMAGTIGLVVLAVS